MLQPTPPPPSRPRPPPHPPPPPRAPNPSLVTSTGSRPFERPSTRLFLSLRPSPFPRAVTSSPLLRPPHPGAVNAVLFTSRGPARRHRAGVRAASATTIAADANRLAPAPYYADAFEYLSLPRVDDEAYVPALRDASFERHDVKLDHSAHGPRPGHARARELRPAPLARPASRRGGFPFVERSVTSISPTTCSRSTGFPSPPTWLPTEVPAEPRFPVLVKARHGFGSRHIYGCENAKPRLRVLPPLHAGRLVRAAGLPRRGVLDRRLLRLGRALPERDPAR